MVQLPVRASNDILYTHLGLMCGSIPPARLSSHCEKAIHHERSRDSSVRLLPTVLRTSSAIESRPVFMTGIYNSGKDSVARALQVALNEQGGRSVSLLLGNALGTDSSTELGTSVGETHSDVQVSGLPSQPHSSTRLTMLNISELRSWPPNWHAPAPL